MLDSQAFAFPARNSASRRKELFAPGGAILFSEARSPLCRRDRRSSGNGVRQMKELLQQPIADAVRCSQVVRGALRKRNVSGSAKAGRPVKYWNVPLERKNDAASMRSKPGMRG